MSNKTQINLERMKAYDKVLSFEEAKHKRDANGRFTSGCSGTSVQKTNESPLRKAVKAISSEENSSSINNKQNLKFTIENEMKRFKEDPQYYRNTRSTEQGLKWANEFLATRGDNLSEKELKHTLRLMQFRGRVKPEYQE